MSSMVLVCDKCRANFEVEEMPRRGSICFKCHIRTVEIGFTYGKQDFHGPTVRERANKQIEQAKSAGLEPAYVGSKWV